MYRRLRRMREQSEDLKEQIEVLLSAIENAVGDIRVAMESVEDVRGVGIESEEDVIRALRIKVSAALDVMLAAIEEILDVFGYEEGEEIVLGDEEEEFEEISSEEEAEGEIEMEEPEEEVVGESRIKRVRFLRKF